MTIFYIPNPTHYLHLTTTLLTVNKQQMKLITMKGDIFLIFKNEVLFLF